MLSSTFSLSFFLNFFSHTSTFISSKRPLHINLPFSVSPLCHLGGLVIPSFLPHPFPSIICSDTVVKQLVVKVCIPPLPCPHHPISFLRRHSARLLGRALKDEHSHLTPRHLHLNHQVFFCLFLSKQIF